MEAPTPFVSGTHVQYAWDSTSIGYLKRCPRLYYYSMIEGWKPKDESVDLRFGIEYHQALQDYDTERHLKISHDDAVFDVVRALLHRTADFRPDHKYKNRYNLVRSVIQYCDHFKDDPAETYIMANDKPATEVSFKFDLDWSPHGYEGTPYMLCGHLDRIVRFNGDMYVMDRKTTRITPGEYYFNQYLPENQMSLYTLAGGIVFEMPIKGVIIDVMQVAIEFSRPVRGMTYRTQDQLDEYVNDLEHWFNIAQSYAEAGYWPMNDTACDKYGGCKFRGVCSKSPSVRKMFLLADFTQEEPWNPLIPR